MQADLCLCCHLPHGAFPLYAAKKNWNGVLNEDEELRRKNNAVLVLSGSGF